MCKISKNSIILIATILLYSNIIHTMDEAQSEKATPKSMHQQTSRLLGTEIIWIRTSDEQIMKIPLWYIEQMNKIHKLLLLHTRFKGKNNEKNPVYVPITAQQLKLLRNAFNIVNCPECLKDFFYKLTENMQNMLINTAAIIEATGLETLLMTLGLIKDVQHIIHAASSSVLLAPVVTYLTKEALENKFEEQEATINCVAFSSDDTFIVSGAADHDLVIWDSATQEKRATLKGHRKAVTFVAINTDNTLIVSGIMGGSKEFIVWNAETGTFKRKLKHLENITCAAYSLAGDYLVSGLKDGYIMLWNIKTGERITTFKAHNGKITALAISPDGKFIASGSTDKQVIIWDIEAKQQKTTLQTDQTVITCLSFSPYNDYIASGSLDNENNLIIWDITAEAYHQKMFINPHKGAISCMTISPDGKYLAVGSDNHFITLWEPLSEKLIDEFTLHTGPITSLQFSPNGKYLASGAKGAQNNLILWNLQQKMHLILSEKQGNSNCLAFNPQGTAIISGSNAHHNNLILWKLLYANTISQIAHHLTTAQARFMYRLYIAKINDLPITIDMTGQDYALYLSLPDNIQKIIDIFLPFKTPIEADIVQAKKTELEKTLFGTFYMGVERKIATIQKMMAEETDKNSIHYKALQKMLNELKSEAKKGI